MYQFQIETQKRLKKIRNPIRAREIYLGFFSIIQVMDRNGKWFLVGLSLSLLDAQYATERINEAIETEENSIFIDYIS